MLYPLVLEPVFKEYLWGGTKLKDVYHKQTDLPKVAESWELACHKEGTNRITNGTYAGKTLLEYIQAEDACVLGKGKRELPLLNKIIDTADSLSIQVHPDDAYAAAYENGQSGKTELWYLMDCEPGATLFFGLRKEVAKDEFIRCAKNGTVLELLNQVSVKKGDVFLIRPGTVHAIGKGMTVAEIGTNSNITYRVYDFDRVDAQGNPRELHIEKAAEVLGFSSQPVCTLDHSLDCGAFLLERITPKHTQTFAATEDTFAHLLCVDGEAVLTYEGGKIGLALGSSVLIPAGMGRYAVTGDAVLLKTTT